MRPLELESLRQARRPVNRVGQLVLLRSMVNRVCRTSMEVAFGFLWKIS
jgi:acyl-CoA hydrolase